VSRSGLQFTGNINYISKNLSNQRLIVSLMLYCILMISSLFYLGSEISFKSITSVFNPDQQHCSHFVQGLKTRIGPFKERDLLEEQTTTASSILGLRYDYAHFNSLVQAEFDLHVTSTALKGQSQGKNL
jgi:hypothetical protein